MSSKAKRSRSKQVREHQLDPEIRRQQWTRKPQTQVVMNKKAEQRRNMCRTSGHDEGAVFMWIISHLTQSFPIRLICQT